ncbi:MAG TPA: DUF4337 family protein [Caulobacteraceae bacterium]|nr:DUF4337 family protein [Caulobacteraceae bacterium]
MSDSPLEEMEAREHAEHAAEAIERKDPLLSQVTFTIAVLAVLAAVAASLETTEGDATIVAKNDAVLEQNRATDQWNFYEAKSLKKNVYEVAAAQAAGPPAAKFAAKAASNGADQVGIEKQARALEAQRDAFGREASFHEVRHSRLTIGSTLLHMAIAIATLAIILHRRWPWFTALALTAGGVVMAAWAYLV